jgi:hypothetical protein
MKRQNRLSVLKLSMCKKRGITQNISTLWLMGNIGGKKFQLDQDEGTIVGHENLKNYIIEYYKNLFGAQEPNYFSLVESQIDDVPQLSEEENSILVSNFIEEEVHDAIMKMKEKVRQRVLMVC